MILNNKWLQQQQTKMKALILPYPNFTKALQHDSWAFTAISEQVIGNIEVLKKNLVSPGLYKLKQSLLQRFCLLAPAILYKKLQITKQGRLPVIKYGGILSGIKQWIQTTWKNQSITYYITSQLTNNTNFTTIDPTLLAQFSIATQQFIQDQGIVPYLNFIKQTVIQGLYMTPTIFYSQLLAFMIQYHNNFKPYQYRTNKNGNQLYFSVEQKEDSYYLSDLFGISISSFRKEDYKGTSTVDLLSNANIGSKYEQSYKDVEKVEKQVIRLSKQLVRLGNQNTKVIQQALQDAKIQHQVEIDSGLQKMKQQKVQNIPQKVLQHQQKLKTNIQVINASAQNLIKQISNIKLPMILEDQRNQRFILLQTTKKTFWCQLSGINKKLLPMPLDKLNNLPKDIMLGIINLQNRSLIQIQELRLQLIKAITDLTKMQSSSITTQQIEDYVKNKQKTILDKVLAYITIPGQQISILNEKGIRILDQAEQRKTILQSQNNTYTQVQTLTKNVQKQMQTIFGDFSSMNLALATNFQQTQNYMSGLKTSLDQNKMALTGLSSKIQNSLRSQLKNLEDRYSQKLSTSITTLRKTLYRIQSKFQTGFNAIISQITTMKSQMSAILNSLTQIANQISKLNSQVLIIKQLGMKNLTRQQNMMNKLQQFIKKLSQKGLLQFYQSQNDLLGQQQQAFNLRKREAQQKKLDLGQYLTQYTKNNQQLQQYVVKQKTQMENSMFNINKLPSVDFQPIKQKLSTIQTNVDNIQNINIQQIFKSVNNIALQMKSLIPPTQSVFQTILKTKKNVESFGNQINQINPSINIQGLKVKITQMQKNLDNFKPDLNIIKLKQKLKDIQTKIDDIPSVDIIKLKNRVTQSQIQIDSIPQINVTKLKNKISSFQQSIDDYAPKINFNSIDSKMQQLNQQVQEFNPNLNPINDKIELFKKKIAKEIQTITIDNRKLQKVSQILSKFSNGYDQNNAALYLERLPSILEVLFKNSSQLMNYSSSTKNNLQQKLAEIGQKLDSVIQSMTNADGSGGGGDGEKPNDEQMKAITLKFQKLSKKNQILQTAFMRLAEQVQVLFQSQTKWFDALMQDGLKKKKIDPKFGKNVMNQLIGGYQRKMDNLLALLIDGFPTPNEQILDDNPIMKDIYRKFQNPKRQIQFQWWKSADKYVKL